MCCLCIRVLWLQEQPWLNVPVSKLTQQFTVLLHYWYECHCWGGRCRNTTGICKSRVFHLGFETLGGSHLWQIIFSVYNLEETKSGGSVLWAGVVRMLHIYCPSYTVCGFMFEFDVTLGIKEKAPVLGVQFKIWKTWMLRLKDTYLYILHIINYAFYRQAHSISTYVWLSKGYRVKVT